MTERELLRQFINYVYHVENKSHWFLAVDSFLQAKPLELDERPLYATIDADALAERVNGGEGGDRPFTGWHELQSKLAEANARIARLEAALKEMGEEGRKMTDEIERLSTALEWVLKEIQETIAAQRGLATTTIEGYFRVYKRISIGFYHEDIAMLQSAVGKPVEASPCR